MLWQGVNTLVSLGVVTLLFAMIYQFLPDVDLRLRDVWVGALVTAGLFTIGKYLIGLYLGTSGVASAYGAAGSVVVLLIWVYYSAQIVLLGAEFTRAYVERFGARPGAVGACDEGSGAGGDGGEGGARTGAKAERREGGRRTVSSRASEREGAKRPRHRSPVEKVPRFARDDTPFRRPPVPPSAVRPYRCVLPISLSPSAGAYFLSRSSSFRGSDSTTIISRCSSREEALLHRVVEELDQRGRSTPRR